MAIGLLVTLVLQVWLSYLSYQSFAEGNLFLGFFLFLGVAALAILVAFSFIAWRRRDPTWANRKERPKNP
jgi:dolichyl-phosphate-mannose--protein O-mannosyl transferase